MGERLLGFEVELDPTMLPDSFALRDAGQEVTVGPPLRLERHTYMACLEALGRAWSGDGGRPRVASLYQLFRACQDVPRARRG